MFTNPTSFPHLSRLQVPVGTLLWMTLMIPGLREDRLGDGLQQKQHQAVGVGAALSSSLVSPIQSTKSTETIRKWRFAFK